MTTITITPTPTSYANSLRWIVEGGNHDAREWAWAEIIRLIRAAATITPEAWGEDA